MATSLGASVPAGPALGLVAELSLAVNQDYLVTNNGSVNLLIAEGARAPEDGSEAWKPLPAPRRSSNVNPEIGATPDENGDEIWVKVAGSKKGGSVSVTPS